MSSPTSSNSLPAFSPSDEQWEQLLVSCAIQDQFPLKKRLRKLQSEKTPKQDQVDAFVSAVAASIDKVSSRDRQVPQINYPELPVAQNKDDIIEALQNNQVVIVAGETGSGKTTQLPKICLEAGFGRKGIIGHTQPRRLAARSVANRIADELETSLGDLVGFKIRFSDQSSDKTLVKLMTDGILLAEIQDDRYLNQYEVIIIDEAHERSLNIDFILGYLKTLLSKRKDLKVIITSATIDPERFSRHFNNAPMLSIEGRSYPVEVRYRPLLDDNNEVREQNQAILDAVHELSREGRGDILVFLSGEREIRDVAEFLNRAKLKHTSVLPLYARLSVAEQNKIFQGHSERRIVLATNVAETSLTVPGIRYVIDTGTARVSRYSVRSKIQRLPIEPISQASANQRAGRCGRVAEGICIRLYAEDDYLQRPEFTDPEILRTNLASVILQLTSLRFGNVEAFPFVQPPAAKNISAGIKLLEELLAVTNKSRQGLRLTAAGRAMSRLPVDPRYGKMLVTANQLDCLNEVMIIVAGLSIQDPRERPREQMQKANEIHSQWDDKESEFVAYLNLWRGFRGQQRELSGNQLRKWCQQQMLNYLRMREWQDIVSQLKQAIVGLNWRISQQESDYQNCHQAIVSGLLSHVGFMDRDKEFLGARGNRFFVFPGSNLFKKPPKWLVSAELVETSKLYARVNAKVDPAWLETYGQHLCKYRYAEPFWSKKAGAAKAQESVTMLGLPVVPQRQVLFSKIDPVESRNLFIRHALVGGETKLNIDMLKANLEMVADVVKLEEKIRRKDLLVDEEVLVDFYQERLPENICTEVDFRKWWRKQNEQARAQWRFDPEQLVKNDPSAANAVNYPDTWQAGNVTLPLSYQFDPGAEDDGVSLLIPLSQLNQIPEQGFDWLVPGMRHELAVAYIKAMPKQLRRNFVPAPDYARAAIADINPGQGSFVGAFTKKLVKMTGTLLEAEVLENCELADHLRFNFKVLDGKELLGQGRDLGALKQRFSKQLQKALKAVAKPGLEKQDLQSWDFGDLPKSWSDKQRDFAVKAYPALVKDGANVHLKLFDDPIKSEYEHKRGLRQLLIKQLPSPIKYLHEKLPNKAKLGLYFNPFGQVKSLVEDCIAAVVDSAINGFEGDLRSQNSFNSLRETLRGEINDKVLQIATSVERGLTTAHQINKQLKGKTPLNMINAFADVKAHLAKLVYPGFVSDIGVAKLQDWNRYVAALQRRIEKIPVDPIRDRSQQLIIEKVEQRYQACLNKIPAHQLVPQDLLEVRWQIEELRVSLFAQQLGTSMPISSKRIENYLDKF